MPSPHRRKRLGALRLFALFSVVGNLGCTDLTVTRYPDGGTEAAVSGPAVGPVVIDKEGVHNPPTPTPGPYEPIYPVTPAPTPTPRPA